MVPREWPSIAAMVGSEQLKALGVVAKECRNVRCYILQTGAFNNPVPRSRQVAKRLAIPSSSEHHMACGVLGHFFEQACGSLTKRPQAIAFLRPGKAKLAVLLINLVPHKSGDLVATAARQGEQANCIDPLGFSVPLGGQQCGAQRGNRPP